MAQGAAVRLPALRLEPGVDDVAGRGLVEVDAARCIVGGFLQQSDGGRRLDGRDSLQGRQLLDRGGLGGLGLGGIAFPDGAIFGIHPSALFGGQARGFGRFRGRKGPIELGLESVEFLPQSRGRVGRGAGRLERTRLESAIRVGTMKPDRQLAGDLEAGQGGRVVALVLVGGFVADPP